MKPIIKSIMLIAIVAIGFTSCSEDVEIDVRDQAVGTYNGTLSISLLGDDGVLYSDEDIFGKPETFSNIQVTKDETNDGSISINIGGDIFYGSKIEEASNGFTFDIEPQVYDDLAISGYNCIELGTTEYNGAFFSETNELSVGFRVDWDDILDEATIQALEDEGYEAIIMEMDLNKR